MTHPHWDMAASTLLINTLFLFCIKMVHIRVKMVGRWSLWKLEANALLKDT